MKDLKQCCYMCNHLAIQGVTNMRECQNRNCSCHQPPQSTQEPLQSTHQPPQQTTKPKVECCYSISRSGVHSFNCPTRNEMIEVCHQLPQKRCAKCNNPFLNHEHKHITRKGVFHTACYKKSMPTRSIEMNKPPEPQKECEHEWGTSEPKCNFATGDHQHCFKCKVARKTPMQPAEPQSWEIKFDEKFLHYPFLAGEHNYYGVDIGNDIKSFIRQLLANSKQETLDEIIEMVEEMKAKCTFEHKDYRAECYNCVFAGNYNEALLNLIEALSDLINKIKK